MASNAPYPWDERNEYLRRQIAQAQALRAQASNVPSQGQMVGGQYIAPSWAQMMVPLANALRGHMEEQAATKEQGDLMQQMQQDYQGWMQSRPQAQTVNLEGPTMDGSPLTGQVPPTQQQNMEWASRGMANPLSRTLAGLYAQDQLIREPERAEQRQFRQEESALDRAARERAAVAAAQARLEEITLRLEDRKLDRESREQLAREANQLRRDIAGMFSADRRYAVDNRPSTGGGGTPPMKPVPNAIMKTLQGTEAQAEGLANVSSTFKPEYGGISGAIDKFSGTWNPFSGKTSEAAASWWKDYENQAALVERHEKFGTALSAGEQAAWKAATIAPGMKPDVIAKNLATRARLARELHNRIRDQYIKGGYPGVGEAFEPRQAPPVAAEPPVMNSPEEAAKLPPGTQFRTPDGQLRVRQ